MDRREFLQAAAASLVAAPLVSSTGVLPAQASGGGIIYGLPTSPTRRVAWTIDDGFSLEGLQAYCALLNEHPELRMTFFVLRSAAAWRKVAPDLKPFIETGRVQIGNHSSTHPNLQHMPNKLIQKELLDCHHFIQDVFGVNELPIFRPPYGAIDDRVVKAAADVGFTYPILWNGTFASGSGVKPGTVAKNVKKWMKDGRIMLDHANSMATPGVFKYVLKRLDQLQLTTVTILDAYPHLGLMNQ